ncbi:hypothetical protein JCM10213_004753 [Rhodosporidiobolus nylandii]
MSSSTSPLSSDSTSLVSDLRTALPSLEPPSEQHNPLPDLPLELQLEILKLALPPPVAVHLVERRRMLKKLSLISRAWLQPCQDELWRIVPFDASEESGRARFEGWLAGLEGGRRMPRGISIHYPASSQARDSLRELVLKPLRRDGGFSELRLWRARRSGCILECLDLSHLTSLAVCDLHCLDLGLLSLASLTTLLVSNTNLLHERCDLSHFPQLTAFGVVNAIGSRSMAIFSKLPTSLRRVLLGSSTAVDSVGPATISKAAFAVLRAPLEALTVVLPSAWPPIMISANRLKRECNARGTKLEIKQLKEGEEFWLELWEP